MDLSGNENFKCPYCGETNSLNSEFCRSCLKQLHIPKEVRMENSIAKAAPELSGPVPRSDRSIISGIFQGGKTFRESYGRIILVGMLFIFYLNWIRDERYFSLIDGVNLAAHEAGHIFLGFFGRFVMFLGGSIFQLAIPVICAVHLKRQEQRLGWQLCIFWLGQSLLNMSIYAGDAITQTLPLIGGGEHDWNYILTQTGLIAHTTGVARTIFAIGSIIIFYSLSLIAKDGLETILNRQKKERAE